MTASILKQDPKEHYLFKLLDKTQPVHFQGNPLYQATKWHLNNHEMVKN